MSHYAKPILLMFLGSPGAGKSHFSRSVADKLGMIRINSDAMRRSIFGSIENVARVGETQGRQVLIDYTFGALDYVADQILGRGNDLVYDAQHNQKATRSRLADVAKAAGVVPIVVFVDTPLEVALERGQSRETKSDQRRHTEEQMRGAIERYKQSVELPGDDEFMITIGGQLPFEDQFVSFEEQLHAYIN